MTDARLIVRLQQQQPMPLDCEFTCAAGELVALVGPSGSGKTTVLRAIAGLLTAAHGHIQCGESRWFDSKDGLAISPQARRVGLVFQNYALLPHLTVLQNIMLGVSDLSTTLQIEQGNDWVRRVHLLGLEHRRPGQLSGGQQQRVALARALARAARKDGGGVLLLDEPFSAVDQLTRQKLRTELARLRNALDIPIVLVTHDLDEAHALADRVIVLHRGQTLQEGPPREVFKRPHTATIARLVGLANIFTGTLLEYDGICRLQWGERRLTIADSCGFRAGDTVQWTIPAEGVLLHHPDRPAGEDGENPVTGTVRETLRLGGLTQLSLGIPGEAQPLIFQVSNHVIEDRQLQPGSRLSVSLPGKHIHLMPPDEAYEPQNTATQLAS